jgi:DNA-binding transcriptional LysR family regulator
MELRHLRYFVAVAGTENVSRAAGQLHVSQPALSRQIHDLEDELQVRLFERGAQSMRLTAAGKIFFGEARAVLERAAVAIAAVRAVAPSLTVQILPDALRNFQREFPHARVLLHDLTTEEMLAQLHARKIELSLMAWPGPQALRGLRFTELARYPMRLAMAQNHPLARLRAVTRAVAARENFIAYTRADYPEYHAQLAEVFGVKLRIVEEHDSVTSLIAAVESGRGVALVPGCMMCLAGERLKLVPLTPAPKPLVVGAVCRVANLGTAVEKFISLAARPA